MEFRVLQSGKYTRRVLGHAVFLVPLTALVVALRGYERFSAALVAVYWIWVLYDLAWTFALWRLNS
jgi:hypothetical protein